MRNEEKVYSMYFYYVQLLNTCRENLARWKRDLATIEYYERAGIWKEPEYVEENGQMVKKGQGLLSYADGSYMKKNEAISNVQRLEHVETWLMERLRTTRPGFFTRLFSL